VRASRIFPPAAALPGPVARRRQRRHHRRGVFLLFVLAALVMVGLMMVGVARQSLNLATQAVDAQDALQRRWGTLSCQRAALAVAPSLFEELERRATQKKSKAPAPSVLSTSVALGNLRFDLILSDEDAKVNLNAVYHRRGRAFVQQAVVQLAGGAALPIQLLPEVAHVPLPVATARRSKEDQPPPPPPVPAFRHWGEVFDLTHASDAAGGASLLPTTTAQMTCWGRGRINVRRASDAAVTAVGRLIVNESVVRRAIEKYRVNPLQTLDQILEQLNVKEQDRVALGELLQTQSDCFAVWIRSQSPKKIDHHLAVSEREEEGSIRTTRFQY